MVVRRRLRLPEGYSAKQVDTIWHLADPRGAPLFDYPDATTVEVFAWRHVWQKRHEAFYDEPAAFRAGAPPTDASAHDRPLGIPRDTPEAPPNPRRRPRRSKPISRRVVAAAAAGAVVGLVVGLGTVGLLRRPFVPFSVPDERSVSIFAHPKPPGTGPEGAGLPEMVQTAKVRHRASEARYAVSVGSYRNQAVADRMKHLVRSKGYIVDVVRRGAVSQVVTPSFRTRAQAEGVARGFEQLQLPAHLVAWRAM